jgi:SAM-dependent methyltransferase
MSAPPLDRRKTMVRAAYDAVAEPWGQARRSASPDPREREWLARFFSRLPIGGRVLDLGCGSGAPILTKLADRGYRVTGVDLSREQIIQARRRCPGAILVQGDMADLAFAPASFAGVVVYDSLWHVPRTEHQRVFASISEWLLPGGAALFTLGAAEKEGGPGLFTELMGAPIFYDAWPRAVTFALLGAAGLTVVGHDLPPANGSLIVLTEKSS